MGAPWTSISLAIGELYSIIWAEISLASYPGYLVGKYWERCVIGPIMGRHYSYCNSGLNVSSTYI